MAIWQKRLSPPFKRCNERVTIRESCDSDICCGVTPCTLCLIKTEAGGYGEEDIETKGSATLTDGVYEGTVGGHAFVGYWAKLYGVCEFVVELDGDEVGRWELCGYTDGVSCRNPAVTFDIPPADGEEESTATISVTVADPLELAPHEEVNQRCSLLDVVFVIDDTGSMGAAILEVIENASALVALAEAASVSAQFALISFKDDVNTDLSFSVGNGSAFQTAVNLLTPAGGDDIPEASDYALQAAVNLPGWRQGGVNSRKVIVLITDAPPGGYDDVEDAEDLQRLIDAATAAKDAGIILAAVNAGNVAASLQAAVAANGPDGRYIGSVSSMIDRIEGLLSVECSQRPSCYKPFCGSCNCTNRRLCLTVTGPDGCSIRQIIEYDGTYDTCDTVSQPKWPIDIECGYFSLSGDISLVRDEYTGDCLLLVPGRDEPVELTNCYPLEASWEIANEDPYGDPYLFSVVGNDCGDCDPPEFVQDICGPDECCFPVNPTLLYFYSFHTGPGACVYRGVLSTPDPTVAVPNFPNYPHTETRWVLGGVITKTEEKDGDVCNFSQDMYVTASCDGNCEVYLSEYAATPGSWTRGPDVSTLAASFGWSTAELFIAPTPIQKPPPFQVEDTSNVVLCKPFLLLANASDQYVIVSEFPIT